MSNAHPVIALADAIDFVAAAARQLPTDPTHRPAFIAAVEAAREAVEGVDEYVRGPLGTRPGEWGAELKELLSWLAWNAEHTNFRVEAWVRGFQRLVNVLASKASLLRNLDVSAAPPDDIAAAPEVMTADEACRFLRLDTLHDGNMGKARAALDRLVDKRTLVPIVYAGPGSGRRMYPRQALRDLVERQMGR